MKQWYDKEEDVLNIQIRDVKYWKSIELPIGIVVDIAEDGTIIALEIIKASKVFMRDAKRVLKAVS